MSGEREHLTFLSRKIKPFILRRTKEIVAKDLPPKVEEIIYLDMDEDQSKYYDSIKAAYQKKVMKQVETEGFAKSQFIVLEALMRMRQACLSPLLIDSKRKESAVKLTYLEENLSEIIEGGHSVLIFSQFPSFLSHVRGLLERQHHPYFYLDGKTKDRQSLVEGFNRGEKKIFLISLKAGGTGLNLVSADYVIHLDPWWNPAVEAQATDRAHRIGQTRTVFVQKLIVRGTIEEKVLELQNKKKQIVSDIFSGDWSGKLTKGDLAYIFS